MTLSTNIYVLDECDVAELFRFCQTLLTRYDDEGGHREPDQQHSTNQARSERGGRDWSVPENPRWSMSNKIGQGLPAILNINYRPGGPLATQQQAESCTSDCEPDSDYHYHPHACWLDIDIDFDTAYGARFEGGMGCGDLHAVLVAEVGRWCDALGLRWEWRNEFTGEVHGGEDRYERLVDLVSGGFEATAWYQTTALPAILGHIAEGGEQ